MWLAGLGAVSALGHGAAALAEALRTGREGVVAVRGFSTEGFDVHIAGIVPDAPDDWRGKPATAAALCERFALEAAREAAEAAALARVAPERVAVLVGVSLGPVAGGVHQLPRRVAEALGARGPAFAVSTACTSSTAAIGFGLDLLRADLCDAVVAGGADVLTPELFAGFHALHLLSAVPCAPFSTPFGTTLGEGAGFVVLTRARGEARERVVGHGLSCDAFHPTAPDPTGSGIARSLRAALADARVEPARVGYVNAHATGTEANDPAEWRALREVFGRDVPTSGSKSFLGHAQGAAGVLELASTLVCTRRGAVPPTRGFRGARPRCPADPVAGERPRDLALDTFVSTSSAFAGSNAAIVVTTRDEPEPPRPRRVVRVRSAGAVGPFGPGVERHRDAHRSPLPTGRARAPLPAVLARADEREYDPASVLLVGAAAEALERAGAIPRGPARDRTGIFTATTRMSPASSEELSRSVEERGLQRLSAKAFTRLVLNASTGIAARALGLRGATTTVTSGAGGGLLAVALAALYLQTHDEVDDLVAGAVEELRDDELDRLVEGAACVLLGARADAGGPIVAGVGLAGARAEALALAGAPVDAPVLDVPDPSVGAESSLPSAFAIAAAATAITRGELSSAVVVDARGTLATALYLRSP